MAQQIINRGTTANDGTGDSIRSAAGKINDNFTELYDVTTSNSSGIAGINVTISAINNAILSKADITYVDNAVANVESTIANLQDSDNQTLTWDGTNLVITGSNTDVSIASVDLSGLTPDLTSYATTVYVDSAISTAVNTAINDIVDSDNQSLSFNANTGTISISGGNAVALNDLLVIPENDIVANTVTINTLSTGVTGGGIALGSPVILPNVTEEQRDNLVGQNGMIVYNSDTNKFQGYANSVWVDLH